MLWRGYEIISGVEKIAKISLPYFDFQNCAAIPEPINFTRNPSLPMWVSKVINARVTRILRQILVPELMEL